MYHVPLAVMKEMKVGMGRRRERERKKKKRNKEVHSISNDLYELCDIYLSEIAKNTIHFH